MALKVARNWLIEVFSENRSRIVKVKKSSWHCQKLLTRIRWLESSENIKAFITSLKRAFNSLKIILLEKTAVESPRYQDKWSPCYLLRHQVTLRNSTENNWVCSVSAHSAERKHRIMYCGEMEKAHNFAISLQSQSDVESEREKRNFLIMASMFVVRLIPFSLDFFNTRNENIEKTGGKRNLHPLDYAKYLTRRHNLFIVIIVGK